ncbi:ANTAR domain-containing protein [Mycobacterium sp. URHB0021]
MAWRARETASDPAGTTNAAGVDEAKRMIMERFGVTATEANTLLTKLSQDSNTPVTDIAANIVTSGSVLSIVG